MWPVTPLWAEMIAGDHSRVVAWDAWYDGSPSHEGLPVISGSWRSEYDGDQVRAWVDLRVDSVEGVLLPAHETDPLAPYGQLLVGGVTVMLPTAGLMETVPLGTYRIETTDPGDEGLRRYTRRGVDRWLHTGGVISVAALDCLADLVDAQFVGPTAPARTSAKEIVALADGYVPVAADDLADTAIPSTVTYSDSRWDAIKAIAATQEKVPYPSRDGYLRFATPSIAAVPAWEVTVDAETLVKAQLRHDRQGLVNQVITTGELSTDGLTPTRGVASEMSGPLRVNGPFRAQVHRHSSPLYDTNAKADAGAKSILARKIAERTLRIPFTARWNPALDVLDTVLIQSSPLAGPVLGMVVSLEADFVAATMTGEATVPRGALT